MNDLAVIPLCMIEGDDEPRIRDLDLAERLGFKDPIALRKLIRRNLPEIATYGVISIVERTQDNNGLGGRPATEYNLNEGQALLVCVKSEASLAPQVRKAVIDVYLAWRHRLAEILRKELDVIRSEISELRATHDERIACLAGMTVYEIAEQQGVERKGRGKEIPRMRRHLMRWCEQRGIEWRKNQMHIFRRYEEVFPTDRVSMWWRDYQAWKAERAAHSSKNHQRSLKLV